LARDDKDLAELRKKFVCVRVVQMKGVDVSLFQFNWNVMLYAVFMNADGTIYARYGSPDPKALSTAAFRGTMERVLEAHAKEDRSAFKGKRGEPLPWATPEAMPVLAARFKDAGAPPKSCIHCHHVWVGLIQSTVADGKTMPAQFIWPYPKPESLGLSLDLADPRRVTAVADGSAAAKAGAKPEDAIERAGGQAILTMQDLEWVLHHAPDKGELAVDVRRGSESVSLRVELAEGWRRSARRGVFGVVGFGMRLQALTADERAKAGIAEGRMALRASNVGGRGPAAAAGFRNGDVIVSVEGRTDAWEDDQLVAFVRMNYAKGAKVKFEVRRSGETVEIVYEIK